MEDFFNGDISQYIKDYQFFIDAINGNIHPNSAYEAELLEKQKKIYKNFTKYATGGYISYGNQGIVAESGPELLQVMNGGVKITPLSDSATNSSTISGGQKVFHNTFNINNPQIASDMDIDYIARRMAEKQRIYERGHGG